LTERSGGDRGDPAAFDFFAGPHTAAAKKRDWRAPSLGGVLQEKRQNDAGDDEELSIHEQTKQHAGERDGRSVHFQHAFHVPFCIELFDPARKRSFAFSACAQHAPLRRAVDPLVERGW
jgi:hypothetical protein